MAKMSTIFKMESAVENGFERLKQMTNDELYEKTFITHGNLEEIKNKNFEAFTRFKFNGFIDILTKRLNLDLTDLRVEGERYFDSITPIEPVESEKEVSHTLFLDKKRATQIGLAILGIVILVGFWILKPSNDTKEEPRTDELPIEERIEPNEPSVVTSILPPVEINSTTQEENLSAIPEVESGVSKIEIIPAQPIWIGVKDLKSGEKIEQQGKEPLFVDTNKDQIILVNGAYFTLKVAGEEKVYAREGRARFLLKDGKIEEIKFEVFKSYNNGKAW